MGSSEPFVIFYGIGWLYKNLFDDWNYISIVGNNKKCDNNLIERSVLPFYLMCSWVEENAMNLILSESVVAHWTLFACFDYVSDTWFTVQMTAHCWEYFVKADHFQANGALGVCWSIAICCWWINDWRLTFFWLRDVWRVWSVAKINCGYCALSLTCFGHKNNIFIVVSIVSLNVCA